MELFLKIEDPWKVFLTTDHPNAGPFTAYPWIIKLLMDKNYRKDYISDLNDKFDEYTDLSSLDREYSLSEIAVISRSGPAKALGLKNKGHLGVGADADITIYNNIEDNDIAEVFAHPAYVFKSGKMIVKAGELLDNLEIGKTLVTKPEYDQNIIELIREDFQKYYSISIDNYPVTDHYYDKIEVIPCVTKE
jgi:formylmethanofuran dehydrogenase subunit A